MDYLFPKFALYSSATQSTQLFRMIQHRAVLIIFPIFLQTIITAQMLSTGWDEETAITTNHIQLTTANTSLSSWTSADSRGATQITVLIASSKPGSSSLDNSYIYSQLCYSQNYNCMITYYIYQTNWVNLPAPTVITAVPLMSK